MQITGGFLAWGVLTALVAALSLGPSFAHALEAGPRLKDWSPQLWRETTVFNRQFALFGAIGGPLEAAAIACPAVLAWLLRDEGVAFACALAATACQAGALLAWLLRVRPANAVMQQWTPGPIAPDFARIRKRWETGHLAIAAIKLAGFTCAAAALLLAHRPA